MNKLLRKSAVIAMCLALSMSLLSLTTAESDDCNELFASQVLEAIQKADADWLLANTSAEMDLEALQATLDAYRSVVSTDRYDYFGFQGFRQAADGESREQFNGHLWFQNGGAICGLNVYTTKENGECKLSELRFYGYSAEYNSIAYPGGPLDPAEVPPPPPPPPPVGDN